MGVYVDILDEIFTRLNTLSDFKAVYFGNRALVETSKDFPAIFISWARASEIYSGNDRKRADVEITISIYDRVEDEKVLNKLFNKSSTSGIVYLLEQVLDVLNETTGQVLDPRFGQFSYQSSDYTIGAIEVLTDGYLKVDINLVAKVKEFIINVRQP